MTPILSAIEKDLEELRAVEPLAAAAYGAVQKFRQNTQSSDGERVQAFCDVLLKHVGPLLPATGAAAPMLAFLAEAEPFIGQAIDAVEGLVAEVAAGAQQTLPADGPGDLPADAPVA